MVLVLIVTHEPPEFEYCRKCAKDGHPEVLIENCANHETVAHAIDGGIRLRSHEPWKVGKPKDS